MKKDSPRNHLEKNSKPQVTASEQNKSIILSINEWNFNFQHHISREMGKNELNAQSYSFQKYCSSAFSLSNRWERDKCIEKKARGIFKPHFDGNRCEMLQLFNEQNEKNHRNKSRRQHFRRLN